MADVRNSDFLDRSQQEAEDDNARNYIPSTSNAAATALVADDQQFHGQQMLAAHPEPCVTKVATSTTTDPDVVKLNNKRAADKRYHEKKKRIKVEMETKTVELTVENKSLRAENEDLISKNEKLRDANWKLSRENERLRGENEDFKGENESLRRENGDFNSNLRHGNEKLRGENDCLRRDNERLRAENGELNRENKRWKDENGKLRGENERLKFKCFELTASVQNLTQQLVNRDLQLENVMLKFENAKSKLVELNDQTLRKRACGQVGKEKGECGRNSAGSKKKIFKLLKEPELEKAEKARSSSSMPPVSKENDLSAGSSPLSGLSFSDLNEVQWEIGGSSKYLTVQKVPSFEIDWSSF